MFISFEAALIWIICIVIVSIAVEYAIQDRIKYHDMTWIAFFSRHYKMLKESANERKRKNENTNNL